MNSSFFTSLNKNEENKENFADFTINDEITNNAVEYLVSSDIMVVDTSAPIVVHRSQLWNTIGENNVPSCTRGNRIPKAKITLFISY
jgi:hypothetical protein